jgi:large subunit ribosomal protein L17
MRHKKGYRKLGKATAHRRAMLRNMTTDFLKFGKLDTTVPRAKEVRRLVEKMITLGKRGDLHARRQVASYLFDDGAVKKVFSELADQYKERPGGYTRILKTGVRFGDGAKLATLELVKDEEKKAAAKKK